MTVLGVDGVGDRLAATPTATVLCAVWIATLKMPSTDSGVALMDWERAFSWL